MRKNNAEEEGALSFSPVRFALDRVRACLLLQVNAGGCGAAMVSVRNVKSRDFCKLSLDKFNSFLIADIP